MKNIKFFLTCLIFVTGTFLLTSCASVLTGTCQPIQVSTVPECGARCCLQNDMGQWFLPCTPGVANVHKSYQDLIITAQKPGYKDSMVRIKSCTRPAVFGNILLGGAIGAGVDVADGAAYDYPTNIVIPMTPIGVKHHH